VTAPGSTAGWNPVPPIPREAWDLAPWNRWTFQRVREFMPTAGVRRGPGPVSPLPESPLPLHSHSFDDGTGRMSIGEFLESSHTDGFIVLRRGSVVMEYYANGMRRESLHLSQSVGKSVVGSVAGILACDGRLDCDALVTHYLPELSATAWSGAKVQHVLDMTTGTACDETYTATDSDVARMDAASGWKERRDPAWPRCRWDLVLAVKSREREHGALFAYRSIETDVLGFVLQRASGLSLAELVGRELWQTMGAEEDACFTVDPAGFACGCGGFNATLRDYARFASLWANAGVIAGRQVLPERWITQTRAGNHDAFQGSYRDVLPQGAYHNQMWVEDPARRALLARGVFGQLIYMDPESGFAAVKLSSWPDFVNPAGTRRAIAAMHALRDAVG
jgi:CubicO group peptidase (beta-lactamase class C family)